MVTASETVTRGRRNGVAHGALRARTHDVLDDFAELRKDMGRLADAANKAARSEVKHAGQRLESIGKNMRTKAGESREIMAERVRQHPGAAVGISLGAGVLIGLLLRR